VRYEKAVPSAFFFQPWAASFSRRRWWGYLAASVIFMLMLSLSTLVSYEVGIQAGMAMNEPVSCVSSGGIVITEWHPSQVALQNSIVVGDPHVPSGSRAFVLVKRFGGVTAGPVNWVYTPGISQCSNLLVHRLIIQAR
jgi:hypothetical protein